MKLKKTKDVKPEKVTAYGSTGTSIQWLWGKDDGVPHFTLRRFKILPNGKIGLHNHPEEHEIFILEGEGVVFNDSGYELQVVPQDVLYVPANELHGYRNTSEKEFVFLCTIPILSKG
jgi:quercetin dioxygenase-like cupin family protein